MPNNTDKKALVCRVSRETYNRVMSLVEKGGNKPFESVSEYLMSLIYADLGKRDAVNNKIICNRCGASIDKDSRYCNVCGNPLLDDSIKVQERLNGASNTSKSDIIGLLAKDLGITKKELQEKLSKK